MRLFVSLLFLLLLPQPIIVLADDKLKIAVFYTREKTDIYYSLVNQFAESVAADLNVIIEPYYVSSNHVIYENNIREVATSKNPPDFVMFLSFKNREKNILEILEEEKIPSLIFNSRPAPNQMRELGKPRENFKYWLSIVSPDDERAGYDLSKDLIKHARNSPRYNPNKPISISAIEGDALSSASRLRVAGLRRAINEDKNVNLTQVVAAEWRQDTAKYQAKILLKRYPETDIFWTASDGMALGVVSYLKEHAIDNIVVGSIDWSREGIEAVKNGELLETLGNQFMELGWAIILANDFLRMKNSSGISRDYSIPMQVINQNNYNEEVQMLSKDVWDTIDFKRYSKFYNPSLKAYSFDLHPIK